VEGQWKGKGGEWEAYKDQLPSDADLKSWYPGRSGLGAVAGDVSGRLDFWDFDDRTAYEAYVDAARGLGSGELIDRIEAGYCDDTAGGGVRWVTRYPETFSRWETDRNGKLVLSNIKLARRPKLPSEKQHEKDTVKTLIEMPAYAILAPTNGKVHPSGKAYTRRAGGFATIVDITMEEREFLMDLARSFDQMPRPKVGAHPPKGDKATTGDRPGDDYNAKAAWKNVLVGWTELFTKGGLTYWCRPGKRGGVSATTGLRTGGSDLLHVFTSSTEFDEGKNYDKFGAYTVLNHHGDFNEAARSLGKAGYGSKRVKDAADRAERTSKGEKETEPRAAIDPEIESTEYRLEKGRIEWRHRTKEKPDGDWVPLTNFSALIVGDILLDDGIEQVRYIEIEASFGKRSRCFKIPSSQFAAMNWPAEHLGASAAVRPGQGAKDRTRYAIQVLSGVLDEARVFTATGWTQIDGAWVFMHGGGALGPLGPLSGIEVDLPVELANFVLPAHGGKDDLAADVRASLAMRNVAPDRVTIPLMGGIARAPLGDPDFGIHISGLTGAQKSQLGALAQQHFGSLMTGSALPCNWSSTANSLEASASSAKDVLLVIDDFVPQGTAVDRARLNGTADRVFRALGNRQGRGRLGADTRQRRVRAPRALIVSTGEETPGGQSLRARLVIVEMHRGDVDLERLTIAQKDAADGAYARAMVGYLKWMAPQIEKLREELRTIKDERRAMLPAGVHARTADAFAQLYAAWVIWLRFCVHAKAAVEEEVAKILGEVWQTLVDLAGEQAVLQRESDPVDRFYALLNGLLLSGKAHIADVDDPSKPAEQSTPPAMGWKFYGERILSDGSKEDIWHSQGPCIGWWALDGIYLEAEVAYAQTQQLGGQGGEGIGIASHTLWRRMNDRKLLLTTDTRGGKLRFKVRKNVGGERTPVLHIAHSMTPYPTKSGPSGQSGPEQDNNDDFQ
jgi:hypothetical protein